MLALISLSKCVLSAVGNARWLDMLHKLIGSLQPLKCHGQQRLVESTLVFKGFVDTQGTVALNILVGREGCIQILLWMGLPTALSDCGGGHSLMRNS